YIRRGRTVAPLTAPLRVAAIDSRRSSRKGDAVAGRERVEAQDYCLRKRQVEQSPCAGRGTSRRLAWCLQRSTDDLPLRLCRSGDQETRGCRGGSRAASGLQRP